MITIHDSDKLNLHLCIEKVHAFHENEVRYLTAQIWLS